MCRALYKARNKTKVQTQAQRTTKALQDLLLPSIQASGRPRERIAGIMEGGNWQRPHAPAARKPPKTRTWDRRLMARKVKKGPNPSSLSQRSSQH